MAHQYSNNSNNNKRSSSSSRRVAWSGGQGRDWGRHFVRAIKGRLTLVLRISVCHVNYAPKNEWSAVRREGEGRENKRQKVKSKGKSEKQSAQSAGVSCALCGTNEAWNRFVERVQHPMAPTRAPLSLFSSLSLSLASAPTATLSSEAMN